MENTSDSFMPGPLLFCMKIERSVCYKVTDNTKCIAIIQAMELGNPFVLLSQVG